MFDSPWHWAVVAVVAFVLFFGWKNLPDMSRSLGRSLRIFKTEIKGMAEDDKVREAKESAEPATPRELPRAEVVRNEPATASASADEPARSRPRPSPSPNGRA